MQEEMRLSFLTWDKVDKIPFPPEVSEIIKTVKWAEQDWQVQGLPIPFAKYSILDGKTLYLDELPNGKSKVEKMEDFTGKILMGSFFVNPDKEDFNYFLTYVVTFFNGHVMEVQKENVIKQEAKTYHEGYQQFQKHMEKMNKRHQSWWYKYLYRPYAIAIRFPVFWLIRFLDLLKFIIVKVTKLLTPM